MSVVFKTHTPKDSWRGIQDVIYKLLDTQGLDCLKDSRRFTSAVLDLSEGMYEKENRIFRKNIDDQLLHQFMDACKQGKAAMDAAKKSSLYRFQNDEGLTRETAELIVCTLNDCLSTYCGFVVTNPKPLPQKKTPPKEKPSPTMNSSDKFVSEETMNLLLDEEPLWLIKLAAYVEGIFEPERKLAKMKSEVFARKFKFMEKEKVIRIRNRCEMWRLRGKPVQGTLSLNAAFIFFQDGSLLLSHIKQVSEIQERVNISFECYALGDGAKLNLNRVIFDDTWGEVGCISMHNSLKESVFSEVKTLEIPESLICYNIRWHSDKLEQIQVDSGNKTLYSEDGVIYRKDTDELVFYPGGKIGNEFKIPYDSVHNFEIMEKGVFGSCPKTLIIGKEVRRLGKEVWTLGESSGLAFFDADKLEKIIFQGEKVMIGPDVFENDKLESGLYTIDIECPTDFDFEYVKNGWIRYSANRCVHCGKQIPLLQEKCACGKAKPKKYSDLPSGLSWS